MPSSEPNTERQLPLTASRRTSSVLPTGYTWLNCPVPTEVHTQLHHMARLSNMSLKAYVGLFLRTATPIAVDSFIKALPNEATAKEKTTHEVPAMAMDCGPETNPSGDQWSSSE